MAVIELRLRLPARGPSGTERRGAAFDVAAPVRQTRIARRVARLPQHGEGFNQCDERSVWAYPHLGLRH